MVDVRYTVRGFELYRVNPELVSDLGSVVDRLFDACFHFPDPISWEHRITLMPGKEKDGVVNPKSPWADIRFKYNEDAWAINPWGILLKQVTGQDRYIQIREGLPDGVSASQAVNYTSNVLWELNETHVRGRAVDQLIIDRGEKYDTVRLILDNRVEMVFFYQPDTLMGIDVAESGGASLSRHYVLPDVDPSASVISLVESFTARRNVVYKEGLDGSVRPFFHGQKVNYKGAPSLEVKVVEAQPSDSYAVLFKASTSAAAQDVYRRVNRVWGDQETGEPSLPFDIGDLGPDFSSVEAPQFSVQLMDNRGGPQDSYGLSLTTISTGAFTCRSDIMTLLRGSLIGIRLTDFDIFEVPTIVN